MSVDGPAGWRHSLAACARRVCLLAGAHVWMALHICVAMNALLGALYLFVPPLAILAIALQLDRFGPFSLAIAIVWLLLCALSARTFRRRLAALPVAAWLFLAPVPLVWLPMLSGEIVRAVAMRAALVRAGADCHATSTFIGSMHRWSEYAPAHAWMVADGVQYIWSYGEMRFIPDSRPWRAGARCLAKATD